MDNHSLQKQEKNKKILKKQTANPKGENLISRVTTLQLSTAQFSTTKKKITRHTKKQENMTHSDE